MPRRTESPTSSEMHVAHRRNKDISVQTSPALDTQKLFPASLAFFNSFSLLEQEKYAKAMNSVVRMRSGREKGFPIPPDFIETDLDHINDGMGMMVEYSGRGLNLNNFIDFAEGQIMFGLHDIAEPYGPINDRPPVDRTPEDERAKRLEPYAAERMLRKISNPALGRKAMEYYRRFEKNDPNDLTVQMVRFVDKAQGTTRVAGIMFDTDRVTDEATLNRMRQHLWGTVPRMMEPAFHLMVGLPIRAAREEMREIVMSELSLLEKYGPKEIARAFMKGFAA